MVNLNLASWSGYNNAGIAAIAIGSTLEHCQSLSLSKALLVMPLAMHNSTIKYLARGNIRSREISALLAIRPDFVQNFNERYHASLAHSINGIQLLNSLEIIRLDDGIHLERSLDINSTYGKRAELIAKAALEISHLLKSSEVELYVNLRVQL
ncbi:hypothetical protein KIH32_01325 [Pseudomonas fluorescens]|uniref:three component ABC system middle component n=1 Tax=Pseudomonas fluorescens TaxID=294 RepID=UPI001BD9DFB1|nr:three component ABC system middle component [Pseudomonas fluorescens]MBT0622531.1 hypothetical protein [Pseudomonas fluorescens]